MFVDDAQMQSDSWRQGDIVAGVPVPLFEGIDKLLGLANVRSGESYFTTPSVEFEPVPHWNDPHYFSAARVKVRLSYCAVLSNCCSLEVRTGKLQLQSITFARLMPVDPNLRKDEYLWERIKANGDPRTEPHALRYFYISPDERLENKEWLVDFSQILSLPKPAFKEALKRKILQMDDRTRVKFKIRAGWYIARLNEEEKQAGLDKPWAADDVVQLRRGLWQRIRKRLSGASGG